MASSVSTSHPVKRSLSSQNGGASRGVNRTYIRNVVTGMNTPTATT